MAVLATLSQAKDHLRIKDDDHNTDVYMKLQQASDIVLDYLKARAHRPSTIVSSSIASPTVITTDEAHGYANGESVIITDHEDSTPTINGTHVVSSVTEFTFTVPIAVTVAGTGGIATVQWTSTTVPNRVHAATLLVLEDLHEHRPIDWEAQRRLLERSRDPAFA